MPLLTDCSEPELPLDVDFLIRRNGLVVGASKLFDGTAEALEVDASQSGVYEISLGTYGRPTYTKYNRFGIAWTIVEK